MIPDFRNCKTSPDPGCTTTATVSATSATSVSDWPDADRLDHHDVERAASACAAVRVAGASPPSRPPAAIERTNTDWSTGSTADPGAIAEQRAAGALGGRVHREHGHRAVTSPPRLHERGQQRGLAGARRARDPDDVRAGLAAQRGGGDALQERVDLRSLVARAALDEVEHRRCGAQIARAQPRGELCATVGHRGVR